MISDLTWAPLNAPPRRTEPSISAADRKVLRQLASQVTELAARPIEMEKRDLWYRHNALEATRPLIFCDAENAWNEIVTPHDLLCRVSWRATGRCGCARRSSGVPR